MVATAARAPSISRRMKPTSSKSGATQSGASSFRFRRAIGRSEAGGASKTFAQREAPMQFMRREARISRSGVALHHGLKDVQRPAMVSDFGSRRQLFQLEPLGVCEAVRWLESGPSSQVDLVVERQVPCAAVALERFDMIQPWFQSRQAELFFQDPRPRALGMFEVAQLIVGQEPSALVVVLRHVAV